jgi:hypothetical protein
LRPIDNKIFYNIPINDFTLRDQKAILAFDNKKRHLVVAGKGNHQHLTISRRAATNSSTEKVIDYFFNRPVFNTNPVISKESKEQTALSLNPQGASKMNEPSLVIQVCKKVYEFVGEWSQKNSKNSETFAKIRSAAQERLKLQSEAQDRLKERCEKIRSEIQVPKNQSEIHEERLWKQRARNPAFIKEHVQTFRNG